MDKKYRLVATAAFGIESVVSSELKRLNFENIKIENGKISYDSDIDGIVKSNLWLRCADRVYIELGKFNAITFTDLFDGVKTIPWEEIVPFEGRVIVNAKSIKSMLYSKSDIQSISKKSISDRLCKFHKETWLPETGQVYSVTISIFNDEVSVLLDTSGEALHKRGYREHQTEAPMKETLASALVLLSNWNFKEKLIDPMCGSGTILIEAALFARNIAPGLQRKFAAENWDFIPTQVWKNMRKEAYEAIRNDVKLDIVGSDKDPQAVKYSVLNAKAAGVDEDIVFSLSNLTNFNTNARRGSIITNPPYGERLEDEKSTKELYKLMSEKFSKYVGFDKNIITSFEGFESVFGKKADKNRKLFNGKIKAYYYQYYGEK